MKQEKCKKASVKKTFVSVLLSASLTVSGIGFSPAEVSYAAGEDAADTVSWVMSTENNLWQKQQDLTVSASDGTESNGHLTIEVDEEKTYQELAADAWGGRFSESGWAELQKLSESDRNAVLDLLFDPNCEEGLHLTMGRIPIGASDYAGENYSLASTQDDYEMSSFTIERDKEKLIPYIKEALKRNPGMRFWASPWSPPVWMKTEAKVAGGAFVSKYMEAYALYFQKFVEAYGEEGIEIDMVAPQNEPFEEIDTTGHPSCKWTADQLSEFIKSHLGPRMRELGVEIYLGNFNTPNDDYFAPVLNDMDVRKYVSGINFQKWAYNKARAMYGVGYKQDMMQAGVQPGDGKNTWKYAEDRFDGMWLYFSNGISSYNLNNMVLPEGGENVDKTTAQNSPITVDGETKTFAKTPQYYQIKHFTEFVKPGARRIESGGTYDTPYVINADSDKEEDSVYTAELREIAFRNLDGTLAVLVKNGSAEEKEVDIKFGNKMITVKLPAHSISTFTMQGTELTGTETDQTQFIPQSELVKLVNKENGQVLCVEGGKVSSGAKLLRWNYSGCLNQQWYKKSNADGTVKLVNAKSFNVLTAASSNQLAAIDLQPESDGKVQDWQLVEKVVDGKTYYKIKMPKENIQCASFDPKGSMILWDNKSDGDNDQLWTIEEVYTDRPSITNVTITPDAVSGLKPRETQQFTATVAADGKWTGEDSLGTVTWTMEGNQSANTTLSRTGLLTIGADEKAEQVTVTAVSTFDRTKTAKVDVPVIQPKITSVTVKPAQTTVRRGTTKQFIAEVTGDSGVDETVLWSVSGAKDNDTSISETGVLTVAQSETAETLIVTAVSTVDSSKKAESTVTLTNEEVTAKEVYAVTVSPDDAAVNVGETQQFTATVVGDNLTDEDQKVTWSLSGNSSKDTKISETGLLAVALEETSKTLSVTAASVTDPSVSRTRTVTVVPTTRVIVTGVIITPDNATVEKGETTQFEAAVTGINLKDSDKGIKWSVKGGAAGTAISDSGLLSVSKDETAENLTVTAASEKDSTKTVSAAVKVTDSTEQPPVVDPDKTITSIAISPNGENIQAEKGKSLDFTATVTGSDNLTAAEKEVTWSVAGNKSEQTVIEKTTDGKGKLTIASDEPANTVLTVKAVSDFDKTKEASVTVTVKEVGEAAAVTSVTVSPKQATVKAGGTQQFTETVEVVNGAAKTVTWTVAGNKSENTGIDDKGLLTVAKEETAEKLTVTAASALDSSKSDSAEVTVEKEGTEPITPTEKKVTNVSVTTDKTSVEKGKTQQFKAEVTGENLTEDDKKVTWSVSGAKSDKTVISGGVLAVASDETAEKLTVTAASVLDPSKTGSAEITVTAGTGGEPGPGPSDNKEVTGVTVTPKTATIQTGKRQQFTAEVSGKGLTDADKKVTWTVTGAKSRNTGISAAGLLTVASDETASALTVKAVSATDTSKSGQAAVTVRKAAVSRPVVPKKGSTHKVGKFQYKVTKSASKNGTVELKKPLKKTNTSVSIPKTVKIKGYTFKVTSIASKAFYKNAKLKTVKIGDNVTKIGASAFASNKKLTTVTMGKGITSIESKAFYKDAKLKKVSIKSSKLKKVKKSAFKGIYKKAKISVPKKKAKAYKKLLKKAGLPSKASVK